ncbi:hypothetical protein IEO21_07055 [Rhodonia placenta]|uniref:Uncharacterized protein n=1 Tax=Rhodonia placenta TaxID=104341 RepID=A0A8H7NYR7_9APHY|nr:hypothetical protein IEO21_07055 [Postia placenta]
MTGFYLSVPALCPHRRHRGVPSDESGCNAVAPHIATIGPQSPRRPEHCLDIERSTLGLTDAGGRPEPGGGRFGATSARRPRDSLQIRPRRLDILILETTQGYGAALVVHRIQVDERHVLRWLCSAETWHASGYPTGNAPRTGLANTVGVRDATE